MQDKILEVKNSIISDLEECIGMQQALECKAKYLGKKGTVTELSKGIKDLSIEEKKTIGKDLNELKNYVASKIDEKVEEIKAHEIEEKLEKETIDITLPSTRIKKGTKHPINIVGEKIEDLFVSMGYDVVSGPELETDEYCFERLNLPKGHPARDMQDSFYIDEEHLLRTQTSSVQARYMKGKTEPEPIRIIVPGKTYRREDDASHAPQFGQIEGLVVDKKDKNVSLADLKGTLEVFAKEMIGKDSELRFRPSYFPFTEPSYEVDVTCFKCHGKGCNLCKGTGWVEVFAAGVVHPNVLRDNGYDPEVWQGFAFGPGWDRITMFRYGIPDIRLMYQNDMRFLNQFDRKDDEA